MSSSPARKTPVHRVAMIDLPWPGNAGSDAPDERPMANAPGHEPVIPLACALARQGLAVDVYRARARADQPACEDLHSGVRLHRIDHPYGWPLQDQAQLSRAVTAFAQAVQRTALGVTPCDAVHAWGPLAGLVGLRLTAGRVLPLIWSPVSRPRASCRSSDERDPLHRLLAHRAEAVMCTSEPEREHAIHAWGALRGRVRVVPHGVDTAVFRPRARGPLRRALGIPEEALVVLWGQTAGPDADVPRAYLPFLRAVHKLPACVLCVDADRDMAWTMGGGTGWTRVGCGLQGASLRSALCAAADVTLLPGADWDPAQVCPRESMACGTPVLVLPSSADEELRALLARGAGGRVLPRAHPDALSEALHAWPTGPRGAAALDMGCLLRARSLFTWARAAEQTAAVYEAAVRPATLRDTCRPLTLVRCLPRLALPVGADA